MHANTTSIIPAHSQPSLSWRNWSPSCPFYRRAHRSVLATHGWILSLRNTALLMVLNLFSFMAGTPILLDTNNFSLALRESRFQFEEGSSLKYKIREDKIEFGAEQCVYSTWIDHNQLLRFICRYFGS